MEKFTLLATNFTLPPGLTGWTNYTSEFHWIHLNPSSHHIVSSSSYIWNIIDMICIFVMSCIQDWVIKGEYSAPLFHANCYLFSTSYSIVMRYSHSNIKLCHHHLHFIISSSSPIIWPISSPIEDDGRARGWRQQRNALSEKKYFAILCQWGNTMILVGEEVLCNTLSGVIECMIIDLNSVCSIAFCQKYTSQMYNCMNV